MLEGSRVAAAVRRRARPHNIQRFDRAEGTFNDDGIWVDEKEQKETILLYSQPVVDKLNDMPEAQRQLDSRNGWTLEKIRNKDVVEINDGLYTVSNIQIWDSHTEFSLTRSGEAENIAE